MDRNFKKIFIYCCDFYREQKIKHDNPRHRFELSGCFLVLLLYSINEFQNTQFLSDHYFYPTRLKTLASFSTRWGRLLRVSSRSSRWFSHGCIKTKFTRVKYVTLQWLTPVVIKLSWVKLPSHPSVNKNASRMHNWNHTEAFRFRCYSSHVTSLIFLANTPGTDATYV